MQAPKQLESRKRKIGAPGGWGHISKSREMRKRQEQHVVWALAPSRPGLLTSFPIWSLPRPQEGINVSFYFYLFFQMRNMVQRGWLTYNESQAGNWIQVWRTVRHVCFLQAGRKGSGNSAGPQDDLTFHTAPTLLAREQNCQPPLQGKHNRCQSGLAGEWPRLALRPDGEKRGSPSSGTGRVCERLLPDRMSGIWAPLQVFLSPRITIRCLTPRKLQQLHKIIPAALHLQPRSHPPSALRVACSWGLSLRKNPCWLLLGPACPSSQVKVKVRAGLAGRGGRRAQNLQVFARPPFCASPTLGSHGARRMRSTSYSGGPTVKEERWTFK